MVSRQPVSGPVYLNRIKSGVLADGFNSAMAASLNSLPMTTFSQNNGVIQLTGVASRRDSNAVKRHAQQTGTVCQAALPVFSVLPPLQLPRWLALSPLCARW
jgi:hypothetical protein